MKPVLQILSSAEREALLGLALRILDTVGVKLPGSAGLPALCSLPGCCWHGDLLTIEENAVRRAVEVAPVEIPIFNQAGERLFALGGAARETRFGVGVTNLYYQDPATGALAPFDRARFRQAVALGERLGAYDFISTPGILQDYPPEQADLAACLEMAAGSTKPLVVLVSHKPSLGPALDLMHAVQGSPRSILPYFNPQTPLLYPADLVESLGQAVERGLPVILSNYGMLGATTPASLEGTAALLLAELLAGLVIVQGLRPGAAVALGSLPAVFDMRAAQSAYTPHSFLLNLAVAEVLAGLGLPTCGTSGCEGGWGMDLRAAGELWFNHLTSLLGGVDLVPFVGSIFNSKVFSPELVVYSDLVIRQARLFHEACGNNQPPTADKRADEVDADSLVEEIRAAGHGGHFLESPATLRSYRRFISPELFPRVGLETWEQRGRPQTADLLREETIALLAACRPLPGYAERIAWGEARLAARA